MGIGYTRLPPQTPAETPDSDYRPAVPAPAINAANANRQHVGTHGRIVSVVGLAGWRCSGASHSDTALATAALRAESKLFRRNGRGMRNGFKSLHS